MKDAACKDMAPKPGEPDPFFPVQGKKNPAGIQVCFGCTVRKDCREYKNRSGSTSGVWGGEQ